MERYAKDNTMDQESGAKRYRSTRSIENEDAHRDFDGWDINQELENLQKALGSDKPTDHMAFIQTAFYNIDKFLRLGGDFPDAWRGPECMRSPEDLLYRLGAAPKQSESEEIEND